MKRRGWILIVALCAILGLVFGMVGCDRGGGSSGGIGGEIGGEEGGEIGGEEGGDEGDEGGGEEGGDEGDEGGEETHTHIWGDLMSGAVTHWRECSECEETDREPHTYGPDGSCTACGHVRAYTEGLRFFYDENSDTYGVALGDVTDPEIVIPDRYLEKAVTRVGTGGFSNADLVAVEIPGAIPRIGVGAFADCKKLECVVIGNGVEQIENRAFDGCYSLKEITIPNSVTTLGDSVFRGCGRLKSATIGSGVERIEREMFYGCYNLTELNIAEGVTSIGEDAFYSCDSLTSVTIPDSVISIEKSAFGVCYNLVSVKFGAGVKEIAGDAFDDKESLAEIEASEDNPLYHSQDNCLIETATKTLVLGCKTSKIPADGSVTSIGDYAFYSCPLTSVTIPDSVTSIGNSAFQSCSWLEEITLPERLTSIGDQAFTSCNFTEIVIPDNVLSLGIQVFSYCRNMRSLTIGAGVQSIAGATGLFGPDVEIVVKTGNPRYFVQDNCLLETGGKLVDAYRSNAVPSGVTAIGDYVFYGREELTEFAVPNGVTEIGACAFADCRNLASITIPASVTKIGAEAFRDCALKEFTLPNSVTEVGSSILRYTDLTKLTLSPDSPDKTLYHLFEEPVSEGGMRGDIPSSLKTVVVSGGETIVARAFNDAYNLQEVILSADLTSIGERAFLGCRSLTSLVIPDSVTSIGDGAFLGCSSLVIAALPQNLTSIGAEAFAGSPDSGCRFTELVIPDSVTSIGERAFAYCWTLTEVIFGEDSLLERVGEDIFLSCNLTKITAPVALVYNLPDTIEDLTIVQKSGGAGAIPQGALSGLSCLKTLTVDRLVTDGASSALLGSLFGTQPYADAVEVYQMHAILDRYEPLTIPRYIPKGLETVVVKKQAAPSACAFSCVKSVKHVSYLGEGATNVGDLAFYESGIESYVVGDSEVIGQNAFEGCEGLKTIDLGNAVVIRGMAFKDCTALSSLVLPATLRQIDPHAFEGCIGLTSVTFEGGADGWRLLDDPYSSLFSPVDEASAAHGLSVDWVDKYLVNPSRFPDPTAAFATCANYTIAGGKFVIIAH